MTRRNTPRTEETPDTEDYGLRDLTSSMIRFTNAMAMFSIQQVQNAFESVTDSRAVINRFCSALDSLSNTLSSQMDSSKRSTVESMTRSGTDIVDRTADAVAPALDPRNLMDTTTRVMRQTSESMADMMSRTMRTAQAATQPDSTEEELAGRKT